MEWGRDSILHHHIRHELRNGLLGKLFLLLSCITTRKVKIHEETSIANNRFDVTWTNGHNLQFLGCTATKQRFSSSSCLGKYDDTQVFTVAAFLHREQGKQRSERIFFQNTQLFTQCVSMLYTEKSVFHYYCTYVRFLQIRSHICHLKICEKQTLWSMCSDST